MNMKYLAAVLCVALISVSSRAQQVARITTPDSTYTIPMNGDMPANPFIRHMYTADPSARVWKDGRLYIYASHDIAPPRGCDLMDKYHVFSTDDMVDWIDHGEILCADDVPWGRKEGGFMWAPDCAYKKGKYYFYFPHPSETITDHSWRIGVAVSRHPDRGFKLKGWIKDVRLTSILVCLWMMTARPIFTMAAAAIASEEN